MRRRDERCLGGHEKWKGVVRRLLKVLWEEGFERV